MNAKPTVCVVGSGGREHALASVLARDARVVVTPGNPGIESSTDCPPHQITADLFVVGPEVPLVDGLADKLRAGGAAVFGPGADGAQIEGSKAWMKDLLADAGVPTASHGSFTDRDQAQAFLASMGDLFVIKTDGLAAGKGVLVTESRTEAENAVDQYLSGDAFGDAGRTVVIEEGLTGPELSVFAVTDGNRSVPLAGAQDFKRLGDQDTGPNTGGMGAFSPVPAADATLVDLVMHDFVEPTVACLGRRGIDYRGVLFAGLMLTPSGPKLLEYNCRFGDPETQVVLPRLESSLYELLLGAATGQLGQDPHFSIDAMVTVVAATERYPTQPRTGDDIVGLAEAAALPGVEVFYAGVGSGAHGGLVTAGGRVLNVTGRGATLAAARNRAYAGVEKISWPGMQYRTDIAQDAAVAGQSPG